MTATPVPGAWGLRLGMRIALIFPRCKGSRRQAEGPSTEVQPPGLPGSIRHFPHLCGICLNGWAGLNLLQGALAGRESGCRPLDAACEKWQPVWGGRRMPSVLPEYMFPSRRVVFLLPIRFLD